MTPQELRDRVGEYKELLSEYDNYSQIYSVMHKVNTTLKDANPFAILDVKYGVEQQDTFTAPLEDLLWLVKRRITHTLAKIEELK